MRFDNLVDWLDWQETLHPSAIELGLERVAGVWGRLAARWPAPPVITIAGTNGKGSCAAMLEAILLAAGYRTACYTSPHLLRYNERIRIDGAEVGDGELCAAFARVDDARGGTSLTYFEFGTLAALDLFARARPDVAILEVGLGGRLDAVNIIDPDIALITTIGWDHTAWLGDSLEAIAAEKAGILRAGRPAVIGHRQPARAITERAKTLGSPLWVLGRDFDWERDGPGWSWSGPAGRPIPLPFPAMRGAYQFDNAAAVLMVLDRLRDRLHVSVSALREGLQRARVPGRFQVVAGDPTWLLDVAHNAPAAEVLAQTLAAFPCPGRLHAVLGVMRDKDAAAIARPVAPRVATWHLGQAPGERSLPAEALRACLAKAGIGPQLSAYLTLQAALDGAAAASAPGDAILVFGSFTTVEAALRRLEDPRGPSGGA
jgi:dihydrofolate synthase/folylpolyglutamate synthase